MYFTHSSGRMVYAIRIDRDGPTRCTNCDLAVRGPHVNTADAMKWCNERAQIFQNACERRGANPRGDLVWKFETPEVLVEYVAQRMTGRNT